MKIMISIFTLCTCLSAHAQVNQRTATLRKSYPLLKSFELKQVPLYKFERNFSTAHSQTIANSVLSKAGLSQPSMQSIQKAFQYYNSRKNNDYSAFVMMGYSMITNKNLISNAPQESVRFFPGNTRD